MAQIITAAGIDVSKGWLDVALWPEEDVTLHLERSQADCFDTLAAWLTQHAINSPNPGASLLTRNVSSRGNKLTSR